VSLTIVLSGPKSAEQQARTALASAGYRVDPKSHDHGLPEHPIEGRKVRQAVAFLTVQGEDINAVADAVASLKYVLRQHYHTPEPVEPDPMERLLREVTSLRSEVDELKVRV
jgi:hypothetical protein